MIFGAVLLFGIILLSLQNRSNLLTHPLRMLLAGVVTLHFLFIFLFSDGKTFIPASGTSQVMMGIQVLAFDLFQLLDLVLIFFGEDISLLDSLVANIDGGLRLCVTLEVGLSLGGVLALSISLGLCQRLPLLLQIALVVLIVLLALVFLAEALLPALGLGLSSEAKHLPLLKVLLRRSLLIAQIKRNVLIIVVVLLFLMAMPVLLYHRLCPLHGSHSGPQIVMLVHVTDPPCVET